MSPLYLNPDPQASMPMLLPDHTPQLTATIWLAAGSSIRFSRSSSRLTSSRATGGTLRGVGNRDRPLRAVAIRLSTPPPARVRSGHLNMGLWSRPDAAYPSLDQC